MVWGLAVYKACYKNITMIQYITCLASYKLIRLSSDIKSLCIHLCSCVYTYTCMNVCKKATGKP